MNNELLIERLDTLLGVYGHIGNLEYVVNPSRREYQQYLKEFNSLRGLKVGRDWYFWKATEITHDDFIRKMGLPAVNTAYRALIERGNLFNTGIIEDISYDMSQQLEDRDKVSLSIINLAKDINRIYRELKSRYGVELKGLLDRDLENLTKGIPLESESKEMVLI